MTSWQSSPSAALLLLLLLLAAAAPLARAQGCPTGPRSSDKLRGHVARHPHDDVGWASAAPALRAQRVVRRTRQRPARATSHADAHPRRTPLTHPARAVQDET